MSIVGGIMVPHPPLIIPDVGRGGESVISKTTAAYKEAADFVASLKPETIVLSSPHSVMYSDYLHISPGYEASGDMGRFGAPNVKISVSYDAELSSKICELSEDEDIPAGYMGQRDKSLDHGTIVPLYFIMQKYTDFKLVRLGVSGISFADHYKFGKLVQKASDELGRRVLYVASGDLSHKLKDDGPYGFDASGPVYDEKIMDCMGRGAFGELLSFDPYLCDKAAECGHRSFVIMGGALDGLKVKTHKLSHEDVTGVGYGICTYKVVGDDDDARYLDKYLEAEKKTLLEKKAMEDPYVKLARKTIETYIKDGYVIDVPDDLPPKMYEQSAGTFVSLHIRGGLRGCIGTISATCDCVAREIIQNAISAATKDPRFEPVTQDELDKLEYSVDVLGEAQDIDSKAQLDVKRYGVIVTNGYRRGLLLPDLDGVDNVDDQIAIAKRKAGIGEYEKVDLQRFEVIRHH